MHGQEKKAFDFLVKYHGNGDINNPIVQLEIEEFKSNIQLNGSDKRWWDFRWAKFIQINLVTDIR